MSRQTWQSLNDLTVLFTARPVAIPLIILLAAKIYTLSPSTLVYLIGLVLITGLFAVRWGLYFVAHNIDAFARIYRQQQKK